MNSIQEISSDFIISLLLASIIILAIFLIFICRKKPIHQSEETLPTTAKSCAAAYQLTDIDSATDGFNHRRIIGKGRLGTIYTAVLPTGVLTAVKRIHPWLVLSNAGFGFSSVIKTLSLAHQPNIVPILGFAQAPGERIIVMEFVGISLDVYLHENVDGGSSVLDWKRRFRVAAGVARGLYYLHELATPNIVHGCVKTTNILLDVKFSPKLCDYGLSFLSPHERKGLLGYVDDEYWVGSGGGRGGGACKESDVYGFGVVLLELLSGRRCEEGWLVKWALPLIKEKRFNEFLDPRIVVPCDIKPIVRLAKVASACVANSRKDRPSISQVSTILNNLEIEVCN